MNTPEVATADAVKPLDFSRWWSMAFCDEPCQWEIRSRVPEAASTHLLSHTFPIVFDVVSGRLCDPVVLFIHKRYAKKRPSSRAVNTQHAVAQDCREWFNHLESIEFSWTDATVSTFDGFCAAQYKTISPKTGKHLGWKTVKRRAVTLRSFYKWAAQNGYVPMYPTVESLLMPGVAETLSIPKPPPENKSRKGRPLLTQDVVALVQKMGPLPTEHSEHWKSLLSR